MVSLNLQTLRAVPTLPAVSEHYMSDHIELADITCSANITGRQYGQLYRPKSGDDML